MDPSGDIVEAEVKAPSNPLPPLPPDSPPLAPPLPTRSESAATQAQRGCIVIYQPYCFLPRCDTLTTIVHMAEASEEQAMNGNADDDDLPGIHPGYKFITEPIILPLHEDHAPTSKMERLTAIIHPAFREEEKLNAILEHDPDVLVSDKETAQIFAIPDDQRAKKALMYRKKYKEKLKREAREEVKRKREQEDELRRREERVAVMSLDEATDWDFSLEDPEVTESVYEELRRLVTIIEDGAPNPNPCPLPLEPHDERAPWWRLPTEWTIPMKLALHTMDEDYEEALKKAAFDAADEAKRQEKIMPNSGHNQMLMEQYVIPIWKALAMKNRAKAFIEKRVRDAIELIEQRGHSYSFDDVNDPAWSAAPFDSFKYFDQDVQDIGFEGDDCMIPAVAGALVVWFMQNPDNEGVDVEDILGEELVRHAHSGPPPSVVMGLLTDKECQELLEKYRRKESADVMGGPVSDTPEFGLPRSDTQMVLLYRIRDSITHTVEEEPSIILTGTPGGILHDYTPNNQSTVDIEDDNIAIPDWLFSSRIVPIDPVDVPLPSPSINEDLNDETYQGMSHPATIPVSATTMNFDIFEDDDGLGAALAADSGDAGEIVDKKEDVYLTVDSEAYIFHCFCPPTPEEDIDTWREKPPTSILNIGDKSLNLDLLPKKQTLFADDKASEADGEANGEPQVLDPIEAALLEVRDVGPLIPSDNIDWIKTAHEYRFGLNGRSLLTSRKQHKREIVLAHQPNNSIYMPKRRGFIERGYFSDILPKALKFPEINHEKVDPRDVTWVTHCMNQRIGLLAEDQLHKQMFDGDGNQLPKHKWMKPTKAYPRTIAQGRPPLMHYIQKRDTRAAVAMAVYQALREGILKEEPRAIFVRGRQRMVERAPGSERRGLDYRVPKAWLASPYLATLGVGEQAEVDESAGEDGEVDEYEINGDVTAISQEFERDEQEEHEEWLASTHLAQMAHGNARRGKPDLDLAKMTEEELGLFSNSAASVITESSQDLIDDSISYEKKRKATQRLRVLCNKKLSGLKPKRRVTYFRPATGASALPAAPATAEIPVQKSAHGRSEFPIDPITALVPFQVIHCPSSPPIPFPDLVNDFVEEGQEGVLGDVSTHSNHRRASPRLIAFDQKPEKAECMASEIFSAAFKKKLREGGEKATDKIGEGVASLPETTEVVPVDMPNSLQFNEGQRGTDGETDSGFTSLSPFASIVKATSSATMEAAVEAVLAMTPMTPAKARALIAYFLDNVKDTNAEEFFGKNFMAYTEEDPGEEEVLVSDEDVQRFFARVVAKAEHFAEDEQTMTEEDEVKVDILPSDTYMTPTKARALIDWVVRRAPDVDLVSLLGMTFLVWANKDLDATPAIVSDEEANCFFEQVLQNREVRVEGDTMMIEKGEEGTFHEEPREADPHEEGPGAEPYTTMIEKANENNFSAEAPTKVDVLEDVPVEWPMTPAQALALFIWFIRGVDKDTFDILGFFGAKFLAYAETGTDADPVVIGNDEEGEQLLELFVDTLNRMKRVVEAELRVPEEVVLYEGDLCHRTHSLAGSQADFEAKPPPEPKPPSELQADSQSESESEEMEECNSVGNSGAELVYKILKPSQVQTFVSYLEKHSQLVKNTREVVAYMELPDNAPTKKFDLTRRENGMYNQMLLERKLAYEKRKQAYEKGEFGYALGLTERTDPDLIETVMEKEGSLASSESNSSSDSSLEEQEGETLVDAGMQEVGEPQLARSDRRKTDHFDDWEDIKYEADSLRIVLPKRRQHDVACKSNPEKDYEGREGICSPTMGSSAGAYSSSLSFPAETTQAVPPQFQRSRSRHLSANGPARDPETAAKIALERQKLYDDTFNSPSVSILESPSCQALQIGASIGSPPVRERRATDELKPATFRDRSRNGFSSGLYTRSTSRDSAMAGEDSGSDSETSAIGPSNVSRVLFCAKTNEDEANEQDESHPRSSPLLRPSMDSRKTTWRSSPESPSISSRWVTEGADGSQLLEEDRSSPVSAADGIVRSPKPILPEKMLTGRRELTEEVLEELALLARNDRVTRVLASIDAAVERSYEKAFNKQAKAKRKEELQHAKLEADRKAKDKKRSEEERRRTRAEDMLEAQHEAENGNPAKLADLLRRHAEEDSEVSKELPPDPAEELERLAAQAHHDYLYALDPMAKFNDALMIAIKAENLEVDDIGYLFKLIRNREAVAEDGEKETAFQFYHVQEHQERMQLLAEQAEYLGAIATIELWRQSHVHYVDPDYFETDQAPVSEEEGIENDEDDMLSDGSGDTGIVYERVEALELSDLIAAFNEYQGTELPASGEIIKAAKNLRKLEGSNIASPEKERNEAAPTPPERKKSLKIVERANSTRRSVEGAPRPLAEPATIVACDGAELIKVLSYTSVKEGPKPSLIDLPRVKSKQEVLQMELMLQKARERLCLDVRVRGGSTAAAVAATREQEEPSMFKESTGTAHSSASFSSHVRQGSLAVDYARQSVDTSLDRRKSKKLVKRCTLVPSEEAAPDALPKPSFEGRTVSGDRRPGAFVIADPVPARQSSVRSSIRSFSLRPMSAKPDRVSPEASVMAEPVHGRQFSAGTFSLRPMSVVREAGDMPALTRTATEKSQVSSAPSDESKKSKSKKKWRMSLGPKLKDKTSVSPPPSLLSPSDFAPSKASSELKRISSIFRRKEQKKKD